MWAARQGQNDGHWLFVCSLAHRRLVRYKTRPECHGLSLFFCLLTDFCLRYKETSDHHNLTLLKSFHNHIVASMCHQSKLICITSSPLICIVLNWAARLSIVSLCMHSYASTSSALEAQTTMLQKKSKHSMASTWERTWEELVQVATCIFCSCQQYGSSLDSIWCMQTMWTSFM